MGNFFSDSFSSGGSESKPSYTKQQKKWIDLINPYLEKGLAQGATRFPGQWTTPYEQQGLGVLGQYLGSTGQYMPQRQASYAKALGGQMLAPINMDASRDWLKNEVFPAYRDTAGQGFALAAENAKGMGAGISSSGMDTAFAAEGGRIGRELADMGLGITLSEQQEKRRRDELNAQYQLGAASMSEPQRQEMLGMVENSQRYGGLDFVRQMQKFMMEAPEYNPWLMYLMQLIGGPGTASTSSGPGLGYAVTTEFAGGLGQGLGASV